MRCRDADMMGPICDYISEEEPLDESVRNMRIKAQILNEPKITDNDVADMEKLLGGGKSCYPDECCC
jgi:hypothetical protein